MRLHGVSLAVLFVSALFGIQTMAADFEWDQYNDPATVYGWVSTSVIPLHGQEFVPDLTLVEVAQLWIEDAYVPVGDPAEFFTRIREDSIAGPILGTSVTVILPDGFQGIATFHFTGVDVVPGMRYVLEVVQVLEGDYLNWGLGWLSSPPYPDYSRGREIRNGEPLEGADLWFRGGSTPPCRPSI